jgi:hypothetical protein
MGASPRITAQQFIHLLEPAKQPFSFESFIAQAAMCLIRIASDISSAGGERPTVGNGASIDELN